ncbi:hypothetical protein [Paraburkholderia tropica]|uniref:hypothetical protein n=1 Tax=Paraburkholderia tropica TaxID=92647 RepID=UPI002AB2D929|nr:hypothetical protein [Paraburkholderia tropica]
MQLFAEVGFLEHPTPFSNRLTAITFYGHCQFAFRPINPRFFRSFSSRRSNKALIVNLPIFYQTKCARQRKRDCTPERRSSEAPGRLAVYRL